MDAFSLKGKVAVVTGANQGLGMGYARAFAKAGADVFIPHFTDNVSEVRELIESEGRRVEFFKGDLKDGSYLKAVVPKCIEKFGRLDILVNNAGIGYFENFADYPDEKWREVIEVNMNVVYLLGHEAAKVMMKQRSGKIINIASALSFTADKNCPPYTASKHAVVGITRAFANELGEYGVQVNAIAPGFFMTEVNLAISENKQFYKKIQDRIPAGRWGNPYDLMGTAVFLASRASDYINGWVISVDGGFTTTL